MTRACEGCSAPVSGPCARKCSGCYLEEMKSYARERGGTCLATKPVKMKTLVPWRCARGHEWLSNADTVVRRGSWCKRCVLRWADTEQERTERVLGDSLKKFGLSAQQYRSMEAAQNGLCSICGKRPSGREKRLCVDHNHVTGEVRALLCGKCNKAIGLLNDDPSLTDRASVYLRQLGRIHAAAS